MSFISVYLLFGTCVVDAENFIQQAEEAVEMKYCDILPDMGHNKVGSPWVDVGGLWTPVPTRDLNSDKSERKLLANGSSSADYVEVEAKSHLEDDLPKHRLGEALLHCLRAAPS